ncbi:MAG TPA: hypothetical protein VJ892_02285 [Candidatus Absconditabacterales bacterium]|nr:hypothetical protein [Candidatus Absconditabacterales bacterium]
MNNKKQKNMKTKLLKKLGEEALIDYVEKKSKLKRNQFMFAITGGNLYVSLVIAKNNELIKVGNFSYNAFIKNVYEDSPEHIYAIKKHIDLCIKRYNGEDVEIPTLCGNKNFWKDVYKKKGKIKATLTGILLPVLF